MTRAALLAAAALVACAAVRGSANPAPKPVGVDIRGFAFVPAEAAAGVGDSVVWTNRDALPHTATADSGAWSSPELGGASRFVFVAKRPGRFSYHCAAHPVMRGVLVVRE